MENIATQELKRFKCKFFTYGKVIFGGMLLATVCFCFYGAIRTNQKTLQIIISALASSAIAFFIFETYSYFKMRRAIKRVKETGKTKQGMSEREIKEALTGFVSGSRPALGIGIGLLIVRLMLEKSEKSSDVFSPAKEQETTENRSSIP